MEVTSPLLHYNFQTDPYTPIEGAYDWIISLIDLENKPNKNIFEIIICGIARFAISFFCFKETYEASLAEHSRRINVAKLYYEGVETSQLVEVLGGQEAFDKIPRGSITPQHVSELPTLDAHVQSSIFIDFQHSQSPILLFHDLNGKQAIALHCTYCDDNSNRIVFYYQATRDIETSTKQFSEEVYWKISIPITPSQTNLEAFSDIYTGKSHNYIYPPEK